MQMRENHDLIEVPKIETPFTIDDGPYASDAQRMHMRWADDNSVFLSRGGRGRFEAMNIGSLASLLHPDASSSEDIQRIADWCAWLLLRDDRWDATEAPKEWQHLAERDQSYLQLMRRMPGESTVQRGDYDEDEGLYRALADLCSRLRTRALKEDGPDPINRRLVSVMKSFFFASIRETSYQHSGTCPTLPDYIKMRSVTGGLDILTFVHAALDGIRLPKSLLATPTIRRLTEASHNVCCWHNDLVSLNKKIINGEVQNLILVLQHDPECPCRRLPEAVEAAVEMIHQEIGTFVELQQEIQAIQGFRGHAANWYAQMLRNRVGDVIGWQEVCAARYQESFVVGKPMSQSLIGNGSIYEEHSRSCALGFFSRLTCSNEFAMVGLENSRDSERYDPGGFSSETPPGSSGHPNVEILNLTWILGVMQWCALAFALFSGAALLDVYSRES